MPSRRSKPAPPAAAKPTTLPAPTPPTDTKPPAGSDGDNYPPRKKRRMGGDKRGVGGERRGTDGDPRWVEGTRKHANVEGSTRDAGHSGGTENSAEGGEQDSGEDSDMDSSDDPADGEDTDSEEEDDEDRVAGYHSREEEKEPTAILSAISVPSRVRRKAAGRGSPEPAPAAIISDNPRLSAPLDGRTAFSSLGIDPWLVRSLANMAIHRPTGIQKSCIPEILRGRDCIGGSRTGSGKTVAFAVPILQIWAEDPSAIFAVVLTPTRELALQIYEQFRAISSPHTLKALLITGGADMRAQTIALAQRPHVVISTPGRLADLVRTSGQDTICGFKRVRFVVLDEADRLLDPTMLSDVEECLSALPPADQRQTLLFTATMTAEVRALRQMPARVGKQRPFVCEIDPQALAVPSSLRQMFLKAPVTHREHYLHTFLSTAANAERTMIIFCNRTATAQYIHHLLRLLDHRVTALHSRLPQRQRTDNLARFRAAAARILVATDVASRGLDIPECSLVLNYDVPRDPDDYIHRVGRTARAGRRGDAVTFVGQRDVDLVLAIEARVGGGGMEEWSEEGVNLDSRVGRDALRLVTEKKREALLEIEEDRDVGGKRRMTKQKLRV